jgi:putative MATE family efflux protein
VERALRLRRSPHDREILRLALPALGALAAEPLYLLVDTAIVGHLGTTPLAALAIAASLLSASVQLCNFLAYGTTARVARLHGAGDEAAAGRLGAQALWMAVAVGALLAAAALALADPAVALMGAKGRVASQAATYLRISALGLPFALIALAAQGYLRGTADLRTPLVIVVAANAANVVLEVIFVYGFDWGLRGSAWGTVIAQAGMGAAFIRCLWRAPADDRRPRWSQMRPLATIGGAIMVRTAALIASFVVASAVLARIGDAQLAANQIAFQLFLFIALALDAIAIAGQVIVGRSLGAGDAEGAIAAGWRMILWSLVAGLAFGFVLLALTDVLPAVFTNDQAVIDQAEQLWPLFALMQPSAAVVFALDGILLGAGDARFLALSMIAAGAVFVAIALASLGLDWGIVGVWAGFNALMAVRLATCGTRFLGRRWARTGAGSEAASTAAA